MGEIIARALTDIVTIWLWLIGHLFILNVILSVIIIFFQRRDPKAVWTWLLALYFVPVFGFLFYLILGQDFRKSKMFRVKGVEDKLRYSAKSQEKIIRSQDARLEDTLALDYQDLVLYNLEAGGSVLSVNNQVDIFTDGEKKFADLRAEMQKAKDYIHIQYYIIKNDEVFNSIVPILKERVLNGVEVRVLYDGMGGRFMPHKRWKELTAAGIKTGSFFPPILGRLNLRMNYRNHRKIVVIDGRTAYVGGFNIGKEYISKSKRFGHWRDTHLKLKGDAVISLQIRFALDWNYATGENLFLNSKYFTIPDSEINAEFDDIPLAIQIVTSGPDSTTRQIRDNYLELFHKAKHHIYIQTPYFVPDDAVLSALSIAIRSGVDVRIMIPCKPDHPFVYWATYSYIGDMLLAGAKCYKYENGFLHAKGVMADGRISCYGTANMDIRSFELNFEVNATIIDEETTERLEQIFVRDMECCHEITLKEYEERGLFVRIKEQISRLLSPLL